MRSLLWFRSDLRAEDNTALFEAAAASDSVIAVFVATPVQWRQHDWGDPKISFLLHNLTSLSTTLKKLGIPLLVHETPTFAEVPRLLLEVANRHSCTRLYFNHEYEVNERQRDRRVSEMFEAQGLEVTAHHDQTILESAAVRTAKGGFYTVFSPFHRTWNRLLEATGGPQVLPRPNAKQAISAEPTPVPRSLPGFSPWPAISLWPAGESEAKRRLRSFLTCRAADYLEERDRPEAAATSTLSPYLALGVISPRVCLAEAIMANGGVMEGGGKGVDSWMRQIVWREFYRHVLIGYPRVSMGRAFKAHTEGLPWSHDKRLFDAWCQGRTGFPIVDAGMRQLLQTGWMHNRLRMITAMFLTKDLFIDWRWGERHFMRHLIDGDLANNNGGWQWSASTGTDAAPYFRILNPWSQSVRFDPQGSFIRQFLPELAGLDNRALHDPKLLVRHKPNSYPDPVVDHASARIRALDTFAA